MFAYFDDTAFPLVHITMGTLQTGNQFRDFLERWESYDDKYEDYTFVFDTTGVGYIPVKYAYEMTHFIKQLKVKKKAGNVFLERSIIIANTWYVRGLLRLIFSIQKPVAPVYMIHDKTNVDVLLENLILNPLFFKSDVVYFSP